MVYVGLNVQGTNDNFPHRGVDGESTSRASRRTSPGEVVLIHGDSHYFKVDKPLRSPSGKVLANFTRVETFGSANTQWATAEVDPQDPNVFTFRPQIVPANAG